jgi:hypothetical protein
VKAIIVAIAAFAIAAAGWALLRGGPHSRSIGTVEHLEPVGPVHADTVVQFAWHAVSGAVRYRVDVARMNGVPVASAATLGDTTIDVSTLALERGVPYRWSVTAMDARGHASHSAPVTFTVAR